MRSLSFLLTLLLQLSLALAVAEGWWSVDPPLLPWSGGSHQGVGLLLSVLFREGALVAAGFGLALLSRVPPGSGVLTRKSLPALLAAASLAVLAGYAVLASFGTAGESARILALQTDHRPVLVLLIVHGPHLLTLGAAFSLVFSLPLYWLFRSVQRKDLGRALFEGAATIRRRWSAALLLLLLSAIAEVYFSPLGVNWLVWQYLDLNGVVVVS